MDEQIGIPAEEREAAAKPVMREHDSNRLILRSLHRIEDLLVLLVRQAQTPEPAPEPEKPAKRKPGRPRKRKPAKED